MRLLALDTSAAQCAAALLVDGDIAAERAEPMTRGQAERLLPLAEAVLAEAGLGWRDLDGLAVGVGPGNFTGIRIAVSAVRGLALALGVPAAGVTSFETHAHGAQTPLIVALDARRDRLYVQGFGTAPAAPALIAVGDLAAYGPCPVLTDVPDLVTRHAAGPVRAVGLPPAAAMARVAAGRIAAGAPPPAPLYIRPPDAAPPSEPPLRILDDA